MFGNLPEVSQAAGGKQGRPLGSQLCDFRSLFLVASGTADGVRAAQAEKE